MPALTPQVRARPVIAPARHLALCQHRVVAILPRFHTRPALNMLAASLLAAAWVPPSRVWNAQNSNNAQAWMSYFGGL
jgi:hypothetical protein